MDKSRPAEEAKPRLWTRSFIMVTFANFFLFCGFNMLPSLLPLHFRDLGAPEPVIGFVAGVYTVACVIMRPLVGVAIDRWGRKGVLGIGLLIMCLASISYAVFPMLGLVLVIRFIQGLGWGMANTASPTLASDVIPHKRFGEGMSWFTQGNAIASVLAPGVSLAVYYRFGTEPSVLISAAMFAIALICSRLVRVPGETPSKPDASPTKTPKPKQRFSLKTFIERRSVLPACIMFFFTACNGAMISFVPVMSELRGIGHVQWFFVIEAFSIMCSRPFMGKLVDSKGYRTTAAIAAIGIFLSMTTLSVAHSFAVLALAGIFNGVGYGTSYATFQTMAVAGIEKERRGSATATFYVGYDSGMGLGAIIAGLVAGALGYGAMYHIFSALPVIALIIVFANSSKVREREEARR